MLRVRGRRRGFPSAITRRICAATATAPIWQPDAASPVSVNRRRAATATPTRLRAALIAGTPWLDVFCPGCGASRAIDLRRVDRHPLASVATLVLGLRCSWCPETAPMPSILGLQALPPAAKAAAPTFDD